MTTLSEVFGISTKVPLHTYVDRAGLDRRFQLLLERDRHIVIYGASKQGKTILRKRWLPGSDTIVVQCHSDSTREKIYAEILRQLNAVVPTQHTRTYTVDAEAETQGTAGVHVPLVGKGELGLRGTLGGSVSNEHVSATVGMDTSSVAFVASEIARSTKRCVIEDFHYLSEMEQYAFARDLKAFWDLQVFLIVVGVWAEENMLTTHNNDLGGRVEEVDVVWTQDELRRVLAGGEQALNIRFSERLKDEITRDASENVGLVHRLAEKYCEACNIYENQTHQIQLNDVALLGECRKQLCQQSTNRYQRFYDTMVNGFRRAELGVYRHITHVLFAATHEELRQGIQFNELLARVQQRNDAIRRSDLTQALQRIDRLQVENMISPIVFSFNQNLGKVILVDREFLFYRMYASPLPWTDAANEYE